MHAEPFWFDGKLRNTKDSIQDFVENAKFTPTWKISWKHFIVRIRWFHEILAKFCENKFCNLQGVLHTVEFTKFLYHLKIISWNQLHSQL